MQKRDTIKVRIETPIKRQLVKEACWRDETLSAYVRHLLTEHCRQKKGR